MPEAKGRVVLVNLEYNTKSKMTGKGKGDVYFMSASYMPVTVLAFHLPAYLLQLSVSWVTVSPPLWG